MFGFQRLDAYRCAILLLSRITKLSNEFPAGHGALRDQLRRAALSVPLNIAEGSGRGRGRNRDAQRFYGIARGSALECAAVLDACEALGITGDAEAKDLLERIVSMLTRMVAPGE